MGVFLHNGVGDGENFDNPSEEKMGYNINIVFSPLFVLPNLWFCNFMANNNLPLYTKWQMMLCAWPC